MVWSGERWGGEGEVSIVTIKDSFVELSGQLKLQSLSCPEEKAETEILS